ncbi:MAG: glycoside hydrolase family 16 protein, partial [Thermoplasmata archaeon]
PLPSVVATDTFFEDFSGTSLDTTKWTVKAGGSYISVGGGTLCMSGGVHKRIDTKTTIGSGHSVEAKIKLSGDYQKFGFRVNPTEYSPTIAGFYFDTVEPACGGETNYITAIAWEITTSGKNNLLWQKIPVTWNQWHILKIEWTTDEILFLVDDITLTSLSYEYSGYLPVGLWNDRASTMLVDWVFVSSLSSTTLDQIATDFSITTNDFSKPHNQYETINDFKMKHGLLFSSSIFTTSSADQTIGIFILNRGPGPIDFDAAKPPGDTVRPFDVKVTPKTASVTFHNRGWGDTFSEGSALIGCIQISGIELQKGKANIHLDLDFGRGDTIYSIGINIHVRA